MCARVNLRGTVNAVIRSFSVCFVSFFVMLPSEIKGTDLIRFVSRCFEPSQPQRITSELI